MAKFSSLRCAFSPGEGRGKQSIEEQDGLLRRRLLAMTVPVALFCTFLIADYCCPPNLQRYHEASVVITANDQVAHIFLTQDEKWREQTTTKAVSYLYLQTLIRREDRYFRYHIGINPVAMIRATYQRIRYGRVISGASTITMQTARLLEPRKRTLRSKLIECFRALQLEWHLSKNEILNIYMTLAPLGSNIEGIKAASQAYFQKQPSELNPAEIALIVALVQSPTRLNPFLYPERAQTARNKILQFMAREQLISAQNAQHYTNAPLAKIKIKPPRAIPHLAWKLKNEQPNVLKINTTIDLTLQTKIEALIKAHARFLPHRANAAVMVADIKTNHIVAYVGSEDFYNNEKHGYIDYIQAVRSPGSTLKPFIYALGIEKGQIHSESLFLDERRRYGAYYPDNFDKQKRGIVDAKEALGLSLNIPVVTLLNEIGIVRFMGVLREMDIEPQLPSNRDAPSLAIALGGVGMTLEQLVQLYQALATKSFVSERAANEITNMLKVKLDDGSLLAIKTGTSYGHRDALVFAYGSRYVIGIWCGIHDNSSMGEVWARNLTLPLLEKINAVLPNPNSLQNERIEAITFSQNQGEVAKLVEPLRLLFPVADSMIELEKDNGRFKPLILHVSGGTRPYRWLIDGEPLATQWQQKQIWEIEAPGFYSVTVVDGNGQAQTIQVQVS